MTRKRPDTEDDEPEKKERVIHTRVPESLEAHLRERAQELGMSVSNLVRNVIGHAFGLVGDVAADSHAIARAARDIKKSAPAAAQAAATAVSSSLGRRPEATASIDDVIGWQSVTLSKNAICAKCNDILPKGKDAAIGAGTTIVICPACLKALT